MRELRERKQDIIYELDTMRPMSNVFIGKLVMGLTFAYSMIWMPLFFKIMLGFVSVSILLPLVKEYWSKQIKSIRLTSKYLELVRGANAEARRIDLKDIRKIELIERHYNNRKRHRRTEVATVIFERSKEDGGEYHPETKCVITDIRGNRTEIEYRFFMEGDFEEFINALEDTYAQSYQKYVHTSEETKTIQGISPRPKKVHFHEPKTEIEDESIKRLDEIIEKNARMLEEDIELKRKLEENLLEAYKSIYYVRDVMDIAKRPNDNVIYEFENKDGFTAFFLEDDFYQELDRESIDMGLSLIETATKNIRVAEARTDSFQKINTHLKKLRFQKQRRIKLKGIMDNLHDLQEQNTAQSIEQDLHSVYTDEDADWLILNELEDLSEQVDAVQDLQKAISLNEHISLFDREDKKSS